MKNKVNIKIKIKNYTLHIRFKLIDVSVREIDSKI